MRSKARILLPMLAAGLLLVGVAMESLGQSRERVLIGNPYRDAGGSCVYDREGKVVFAPSGKHCPDATDHLSTSRKADSPIVASYPPGMRRKISKLLRDHEHIAQEIARLRQAVASQNREAALEAVDKIREEVTEHRGREERVFAEMAPKRTSP